MNSGKSTMLINTAYNYEERGLNVLIAKPDVDTKGDMKIVARAGLERTVDFLTTPNLNVRNEILQRAVGKNALNCVIIDEAQFLEVDQVDQLFEVAKLDDISVIAHGLRTDFKRDMFPATQRLFELADTIEKLKTMCSCGSQAEFNARLENGIYVFSGDQVAIDGKNKTTYESLCGTCYLNEMEASNGKSAE